MSSAEKRNLVSAEDYLDGELVSPVKREYLAGVVYRRSDERNSHHIIAGNLLGVLHARLRGRPCRVYNSDTKICIRFPTHVRFYYPDPSVTCRPNPPTDSYQHEPAVVVEVLSRRTRRIDEGEEKDAYLTMPSLSVYILVEQETAAVVAFRRSANGFVREVHQGADSVLPLGEIGVELPPAGVYEGVEFAPEPGDEDGEQV